MDGIHDLAGMAGFGPVEVETDEPTFHEPWEALAFGLNVLCVGVLRTYNVDEYRHSIERMLPAHYLSASYYERTLTGVATLLVEKGILTHEELEDRAGGPFPLAQPAALVEADGKASSESPRYQVGDRVRVREMHPAGHTRAPRYVRGVQGEVLHVTPPFSYPDAAAHGLPPRSEPTYHVLFQAEDLWGDAAGARESVVVQLWETYLEETG
ncbi:MAG: nitrile hydratase subunit beta [bacterium]|nr:nitrile hydratase subunit beta [bacterium]